jgi:hypothetical protein
MALMPALTQAECAVESVTMNQSNTVIREIADKEDRIEPIDSKRQKCIVTFRALIKGKWELARGESEGLRTDSKDMLCSEAFNTGRIKILEKVDGSKIQSSQSMICSDRLNLESRTGLKLYDKFKVSELKPFPNSVEFQLEGATCREFLESDLNPDTKTKQKQPLIQWIIVGCQIRNEWTVIDKF